MSAIGSGYRTNISGPRGWTVTGLHHNGDRVIEATNGTGEKRRVTRENLERDYVLERAASAAPAEGVKYDSGKPRFSLVPMPALRAVVRVLERGAQKYAPDNWRKVPDARTRYYDAAHRHIDAWWGGEAKDPETGEHHLAHAICCLLFLAAMELEVK